MSKINQYLSRFRRVSATEKVFLLQNLSVMVRTGIPIADSLGAIANQSKNKKLKNILSDVEKKIKEGKSFAESLEPYKESFGELFVNMIKSGEASGQLENVLKELYKQTKKDHELMMKVRNAMTYPVIIMMAMIGIGFFVVTFVLPNISNLFRELDVELPITTRILIWISDFTQANGLLLIVALLILFFGLYKFLSSTAGKRLFAKIILKIPVISTIFKKLNIARISRNLSSLLKTDIAIVESLIITSDVISNPVYKEAITEVSKKVKKGEKIAETFRKYPNIFPATFIQMISVGEETGSIDEVLENLAEFYEEEVYQIMNSLPTIIEPILMILIGMAVATVALAIMMPMYSLTESF